MRIKTRYLLLVPIVLITLIISGISIYHSVTVENFWTIEPLVIYIWGFVFITMYIIILIAFFIKYMIENWDNDFYINLKFKNKSEES